MNQYETVFIVTPVLSEEQAKEAVGKFKSDVKAAKGKVINDEAWGLRKLAYPIQKKTTGFYFMVEFEGEGTIIRDLETSMKRDERIMRYLTVKQEKDHVEFAEKRRKKQKKSA